MATRVSISKGTRDFLPDEMQKRKYIFNTIEKVFKKYGFLPIETPAIEALTTLLGKYGEESDKLIFKILNSGNYLEKISIQDLTKKNIHKITSQITEKGLRFDLTVPLARFVTQHQNKIIFPFKRYQIQPVWRADRPQKGRYREFYQCDVDILGSKSILYELEMIQIICEIFENLNLPYIIKINNRKLLYGITQLINQAQNFKKITIIIDKLEKIGKENLNLQLKKLGLSKKNIETINSIIFYCGDIQEKIKFLKKELQGTELGLWGIKEIETLFEYTKIIGLENKYELELSLARGLDYYTGIIYEVKAKGLALGSICGGGRYDELTGVFGLKDISGVGISFGADRIYDAMETLNLFPEQLTTGTIVLFTNFGDREEKFCLELLSEVRRNGIAAEIYPEQAKLNKQLRYANNKKIPFVALIGANEMKEDKITLKNMKTGEQKSINRKTFIKILTKFKIE